MKYLNFLIFFFVTTQIFLTQNIHDLAYPTCDSISFNRFKDYSPNDLLGKEDFGLGICSLLNSQFKQALEYFNLAKEKGVKDEVSIDYYLARCYAGLKNFEESNFYLNKALSNGLDYEIFFMTPEWDVYRYKYYKDIVLKYGIKISKWDLVFLIISLLSLILSLHFFLLYFKNKKSSLLFMAFFILTFSLTIFEFFLFWTGYIILYPFRGIYAPLFFLFSPLLYLYIKFVTSQNIKFSVRSYWYHFIPFSVFFIIVMISKISLFNLNDIFINFYMHTIKYNAYLFTPLHIFIYIIVIFNFIIKNLDEIDSSTRKWFTLIFCFSCFAFLIIISPFYLSKLDLFNFTLEYIFSLIFSVLIFLIAVISYIQPEVFLGKPILNAVIDKVKYKNSGLTDSLKSELKENLLFQFQEKKIYKENDLTLLKLSEILGSDRYSISQVINQEFGKNFYALVNDYRIKDAIKIMENLEDKSISEIAYSSGFNNRVSFNKAFKKRNGMTPSDYIQKTSSF